MWHTEDAGKAGVKPYSDSCEKKYYHLRQTKTPV